MAHIMQIIRLHTALSEEELVKIASERAPLFRAIPGLIQKYYTKMGEGRYGGVYVWDNIESLQEFRASELARSIPQAYQLMEPPEIEVVEVLFALRD